jgi:membrane protein DedA with SNARE-associated domain
MTNTLIIASNLTDACSSGGGSIFGAIADWSVGLVDTLGAAGVVIAIGLETVIPFIPSEVILPLIGATAAGGGNLTLFDGIFWAMVGVMVGAWGIYWLSRAIGLERVKYWVSKLPLISADDIEIANNWFMSKGIWGVLIGRCVPIVRTVVSIPAGIGKMNFGLFTLFTFVGSLIWNCVLIGAGYSLGENWCVIESFMDKFTWVVIIVFVLLIALYIFLKVRIKVKLKDTGSGGDSARNPKSVIGSNSGGGSNAKSVRGSGSSSSYTGSDRKSVIGSNSGSSSSDSASNSGDSSSSNDSENNAASNSDNNLISSSGSSSGDGASNSGDSSSSNDSKNNADSSSDSNLISSSGSGSSSDTGNGNNN